MGKSKMRCAALGSAVADGSCRVVGWQRAFCRAVVMVLAFFALAQVALAATEGQAVQAVNVGASAAGEEGVAGTNVNAFGNGEYGAVERAAQTGGLSEDEVAVSGWDEENIAAAAGSGVVANTGTGIAGATGTSEGGVGTAESAGLGSGVVGTGVTGANMGGAVGGGITGTNAAGTNAGLGGAVVAEEGQKAFGADDGEGVGGVEIIGNFGREGEGLVEAGQVWELPAACNSNFMNNLVSLSFLALAATAAVVALAYMGGKIAESPRVLTWCKGEVWQVFVSGALVAAVYIAIGMFCISTPADLAGFFRQGAAAQEDIMHSFGESEGMYAAAQTYLERLASYTKGVIVEVRYNMGVYELRSGIQEFRCTLFCFIASLGESYAPHGGESTYPSLLGNTLSIGTVALLSVLFQLFLLMYIENGLFLLFLPFAIVMRSVPFMRGFGGALIALVVSLYILYPFMIYVDGVVMPPAAAQLGVGIENRMGPGVGEIAPLLGSVNNDPQGGGEDILTQNAYSMGERRERRGSMPELITLASIVFIAGVFAPALNFIVIAAVARELSRVIGEELDISRLGQMV